MSRLSARSVAHGEAVHFRDQVRERVSSVSAVFGASV